MTCRFHKCLLTSVNLSCILCVSIYVSEKRSLGLSRLLTLLSDSSLFECDPAYGCTADSTHLFQYSALCQVMTPSCSIPSMSLHRTILLSVRGKYLILLRVSREVNSVSSERRSVLYFITYQ